VKVPSIRAPGEKPAASEPQPERDVASERVAESLSRSPIGYFKRLWRAEIPLGRVFWQDMIVVGTLVNLAAMGLGFLAVALGASTATGIAIFLAPVPYNILLVVSVWQRAAAEPANWGAIARIGALIWLLLAFVV
jgi:hypothetical protein